MDGGVDLCFNTFFFFPFGVPKRVCRREILMGTESMIL